ncbi:MAG: hypothetical protein R3293_28360, partial [Candidatus Promineifilaceae bacterium]|nr:hypothetical protein [Candidatus Promineifilaceae bacterium]
PGSWSGALQFATANAARTIGWGLAAFLPLAIGFGVAYLLAVSGATGFAFIAFFLWSLVTFWWAIAMSFLPMAIVVQPPGANPIRGALAGVRGRWWRIFGRLLLMGLIALLIWMVRFGLRRGTDDPLAVEFEAEIPRDMPTGYAVFWMLVGLIVLPLSSKYLVEGAIFIARSLEVSEAVIGLTIMAFGTSLPELAAALTSALRNEDDLAIGNVIGSNMFNILGVLGVAAVIKPVEVEMLMLKQDFPVMFLFTVLLFFMAYGIGGPGRISRRSGIMLLTLFLAYQVLVWITATPVVRDTPL